MYFDYINNEIKDSPGGASLLGGSGASGSLSVTSAVDITLTTASEQFQRINMTALGLKVTLPDPTGLDQASLFMITNVGAYDFDVVGVTGSQTVAPLTSLIVSAYDGKYSFAVASNTGFGFGINSLLSYTSPTPDLSAISETQALLCFRSSGATYAVVLDVSGNVITPGTPLQITSTGSWEIKSTILSPTLALIVYDDATVGKAQLLDISGSTLSLSGSAATFDSGNCNYLAVTKMTATQAIVAYRENNVDGGYACVLDVAGTVITPGAIVQFDVTWIAGVKVLGLTSTKAVVTNYNNGSNFRGTVLDVAASVISMGTTTTLRSGNMGEIQTAFLSSTKFLAFYKSGGGGYAMVVDVAGNVVTPNTELYIGTNPSAVACSSASPTQGILSYEDFNNGDYGTARIVNIDGSTLSFGEKIVFESSEIGDMAAVALSADKHIVSFRSIAKSGYLGNVALAPDMGVV